MVDRSLNAFLAPIREVCSVGVDSNSDSQFSPRVLMKIECICLSILLGSMALVSNKNQNQDIAS